MRRNGGTQFEFEWGIACAQPGDATCATAVSLQRHAMWRCALGMGADKAEIDTSGHEFDTQQEAG